MCASFVASQVNKIIRKRSQLWKPLAWRPRRRGALQESGWDDCLIPGITKWCLLGVFICDNVTVTTCRDFLNVNTQEKQASVLQRAWSTTRLRDCWQFLECFLPFHLFNNTMFCSHSYRSNMFSFTHTIVFPTRLPSSTVFICTGGDYIVLICTVLEYSHWMSSPSTLFCTAPFILLYNIFLNAVPFWHRSRIFSLIHTVLEDVHCLSNVIPIHLFCSSFLSSLQPYEI